MEKIEIHNFGGLKHAEIPINNINIFIGRQASGKSIVVKLVYFFKSIFREIYQGALEGQKKIDIDGNIHKQFERLFPSDTWPKDEFKIQYTCEGHSIAIHRNAGGKSKVKVTYSDSVTKLFAYTRRLVGSNISTLDEESRTFNIKFSDASLERKYYSYLNSNYGKYNGTLQVFIPAGRSFFANLQSSVFSFLSSNSNNIDPFLVRFGSFYESIKSTIVRSTLSLRFHRFRNDDYGQPFAEFIDELIKQILNSKYLREKNKDYLVHDDGRKINLAFSSSGQQEILPLAIILKSLTTVRFEGGGATLYIEEPEAHLFPSSQKSIIELISSIYNDGVNNNQFFITTHSPYIISTFNNLIQGGNLVEDGHDLDIVQRAVSQYGILKYDQVNAYAMSGGGLYSLKDDETKLLMTDIIDEVSDHIAEEFEKLLEIPEND